MKLLFSMLLCCQLACSQTPPVPTPVTQDPPAPAPVPVPAPKPAPVQQEPKPTPAPKSEPVTQEPKPVVGDKPASDSPASGKPESGKPASGKPESGKPTTEAKPTTGKTGEEPKVDRADKDAPVPRGTDPADLAAMRSAEAMLDAERKLAELIKQGKFAGLDKILTFDELTSWPYEDGLKGMPKRVKDLNGKKVLMTGFMLPIDEVQNIKEFLLVQSLWSCCYGQPPDIHGIIRVVMPKDKRTDYFFDPLKVIGTFKVEATILDGYCVDIYQLHVESLEVIK
jgi:hypothetical protein